MSWAEYLSHLMQATNKVEKAAVFNLKGQPLATTEDLQVSDADGRALLHCLSDPSRSLTRLTIDEADFRCFQGNDNALVGKGVANKDKVLVAKLTDEVLVLVIGSSSGHGSFLFEVKKSLLDRQQGHLLPQQTTGGQGLSGGGQQKLLPPPGAVSQEQVLVQLHD